MLTGFDYHGPEGQVVGDRDFGTIAVVGRAPLVLDYQISDNAVYSDGKPVHMRRHGAGLGRPVGPVSGLRRGQPGRATATSRRSTARRGRRRRRVSFAQDRGFVDFGQLFAATAMMPSHVIADELGAGDAAVTAALQAGDLPTVDRIAQLWNTTWNLTPNVDLKQLPVVGALQAELGAQRRRSRPRRQRQVVGRQARHRQDHRLAARRRRAGPRQRRRQYDVVDISAGSSGTLTLPGDYTRTDSPSAGIEQLIFAPGGPLLNPAARRAVALCTPRDLIAAERGLADRQQPAQPDRRGFDHRRRERRRGRSVQHVQSASGARRASAASR